MKVRAVFVSAMVVMACLGPTQPGAGGEPVASVSSASSAGADCVGPRVTVSLKLYVVSRSRLGSQGLVFPGPNGQKVNATLHAPTRGQRLAYVADRETRQFIKMAEEKGAMRTMAEPCLVVPIGRGSAFMSGGLYTAKVRTDAGKWVPLEVSYGQQVDVVPTLLDQDTIRLTMRVELSNLRGPDSRAANIDPPQLTGWRMDTTCEIRPGQTLMLGGFRPLTDSDLLAHLTGENATRPAADRPLTQPPAEDTEMLVLVTAQLGEPARGRGM